MNNPVYIYIHISVLLLSSESDNGPQTLPTLRPCVHMEILVYTANGVVKIFAHLGCCTT